MQSVVGGVRGATVRVVSLPLSGVVPPQGFAELRLSRRSDRASAAAAAAVNFSLSCSAPPTPPPPPPPTPPPLRRSAPLPLTSCPLTSASSATADLSAWPSHTQHCLPTCPSTRSRCRSAVSCAEMLR